MAGCAILWRMNEQASAPNYKRHRFPPEISAHTVWLYFRFALSYRDVEELLAERVSGDREVWVCYPLGPASRIGCGRMSMPPCPRCAGAAITPDGTVGATRR